MLRIRLVWVMAAVAAVALGLGSMRGTTVAVERAALGLVGGGYLALTVAALRAGRRNPGLVGFVVLGWGYLVPWWTLDPKRWDALSPANAGVARAVAQFNRKPRLPPQYAWMMVMTPEDLRDRLMIQPYARRGATDPAPDVRPYNRMVLRAATVGHLILAVAGSLVGLVAGTLAGWIGARCGVNAGEIRAAPWFRASRASG